jgi:hypothetical protein
MFVGFLCVMLGLLGVLFGIVALRKTRAGQCTGRGKAWVGIVLGCLPFMLLVSSLIPVLWQELEDWIGNLGLRQARLPFPHEQES